MITDDGLYMIPRQPHFLKADLKNDENQALEKHLSIKLTMQEMLVIHGLNRFM